MARLADVSKTTVSYVINGTGYVSEERRTRIELAIARLGYRPNAFARGLRSSRVSTVGVVSADAADPFVARVTSGILAEAAARDIIVTVSVDSGPSSCPESGRVGARQTGEPLIYVTDNEFSAEAYATLAARHVVVLAGEGEHRLGRAAAAMIDPRPAAHDLATFVVSSGHTRVAIVTPARWSGKWSERAAGLRDGLIAAGIPWVGITTISAEVSVHGGRVAIDELFMVTPDLSLRPTAVLCVDDSVAIGVLQRSREVGLIVPDHLSVTGFGDTTPAQTTSPRLTTARLPAEEIGQAALEMLLRSADLGDKAIPARMIAASMVRGGSVRPPQLDTGTGMGVER
ncbi:LacI family DNA-binding transcriptional regulator [Microbacterium sp. CCNWLW134]|uniref:LacI family DNA-binding transcriptional regulator n=1 Tax=Microbacterium sp. CCNWLW134 TaxID=3122064 RepID=UPI00300FD509